MQRADARGKRCWRAATRFTFCALSLALCLRARAAEPLELSWSAPPGCPDTQQLRERVRSLGGGAREPNAPAVRAEASIVRLRGGQLHLRLVIQAGDLLGERTLDGRSCEDLAESAAVHLALLLQADDSPGGVALSSVGPDTHSTPMLPAAAATSRETNAVPAAPSSAALAAQSARAPASQRATPVVLQLPLALVELGSSPQVGFGLAAAGGVRFGPSLLLLDARAWQRQRWSTADQPEQRAAVARMAVGVRACHVLASGSFELAPCARISLEHLWARGEGPHVASKTTQQLWLAGGLGLQARLRLRAWLSLLAQVEAQLQSARPRVAIDGVGRLGQIGPGALIFGLGAESIL